jgi:DNA (cytosine-5)-methyltransferase 1
MNVLALCAGYSGIELGIKLVMPEARVVCYVERDSYTAANLVARMANKTLDEAPVWDNVKTFRGRRWRGKVDIITAGYPCQPFSLAGKRRGTKDPRHLWPDIARIVSEVRPPICFFENVASHLTLGFPSVKKDLQRLGYRVEARIVSALECGAAHTRQRLFILGYAHGASRLVLR